ncbi:DUF2255 family protein [Kitasatospora phosalacinea]|uniref:DUF2255 family protein n=1 Tax=Kitasatospora phosalacinea TaxID=2065 RepID=UPI000526E79B|nr:DUF2255 family protein [Kitasatospora phosalacinea]
MNADWTPAELSLFEDARSLVLSAGSDGYPGVEVGMVVVQGALLVRAWRGTTSQWYRAAREFGCGRVRVGAMDREVLLESGHHRRTVAIDAAYRAKYGAVAALLTGTGAHAATLRISPVSRAPEHEDLLPA